MKSFDAVNVLCEWDAKGKMLFSKRELSRIFGETTPTLDKTIERLIANRQLERVVRNLYLFTSSRNIDALILERIALAVRRGMVFEALESAAAKWGIISQVPVGTLTCMTDGRSGRVQTRFGVVEFVHTTLQWNEAIGHTVLQEGHVLRLANRDLTLRSLSLTHRSLDLVRESEASNTNIDILG